MFWGYVCQPNCNHDLHAFRNRRQRKNSVCFDNCDGEFRTESQGNQTCLQWKFSTCANYQRLPNLDHHLQPTLRVYGYSDQHHRSSRVTLHVIEPRCGCIGCGSKTLSAIVLNSKEIGALSMCALVSIEATRKALRLGSIALHIAHVGSTFHAFTSPAHLQARALLIQEFDTSLD